MVQVLNKDCQFLRLREGRRNPDLLHLLASAQEVCKEGTAQTYQPRDENRGSFFQPGAHWTVSSTSRSCAFIRPMVEQPPVSPASRSSVLRTLQEMPSGEAHSMHAHSRGRSGWQQVSPSHLVLLQHPGRPG